MEKDEGLEFAKTQSVRYYPTLLFMNKNGEVVHKKVGTMIKPIEYVDLW